MSGIFFAVVASAGPCGDNVGGRRVPCDCGDVVVSSTRLRVDDPVVSRRCDGDGLVVRAEPGANSLYLDLGGQTLIGAGRGVGVRILRAGESGVVISGGEGGQTAAIVNFGTGLRATDPKALQALHGVRMSGNAHDGARVRTANGVLSEVTADRNGRDGVRVSGRAPRLDRVDADGNGRFGVVSRSHNPPVAETAAESR